MLYKRKKKRSIKKVKAQFTKKQVESLKETLTEVEGYRNLKKSSDLLTAAMAPMYPAVGGAFFKLTNTGDDEDVKRDGDSIRAKSLTIKGALSSIYDGETLCRLILVQYKLYDGAGIDEVLDHSAAPATYDDVYEVINSMVKKKATVKFNILADKVIKLTPQATRYGSTATECVRRFRIHHNFTKSQSRMTYVVGSSSDTPTTNVCYLYACYGKAGDQHSPPSLSYVARERFIK